MEPLYWYTFSTIMLAVNGIIPTGPTQVSQLSPCNSVIELSSAQEGAFIFQHDSRNPPTTPATRRKPSKAIGDQKPDVEIGGTDCTFLFEGPQNTTLTFQLIGVTIFNQFEDEMSNVTDCLTPDVTTVQLYDYTSTGALKAISITCQNETWTEKYTTSFNVGILTTTIDGHFAMAVQKNYPPESFRDFSSKF